MSFEELLDLMLHHDGSVTYSIQNDNLVFYGDNLDLTTYIEDDDEIEFATENNLTLVIKKNTPIIELEQYREYKIGDLTLSIA